MKKRLVSILSVVLCFVMLLWGCGRIPDNVPAAPIAEEEESPKNTTAPEPSEQPVESARTESHLIDGFEIILQNPELPTGCEITALTMALRFYGFDADKGTMASEYLPCRPANLYYGNDGRLYGSDLNDYFIGDPFSTTGIICGTGAIVTAANAYLSDSGSAVKAEDLSGASPGELYELVAQDIPVVVWVTIGLQDRGEVEGWFTEDGDYVDWGRNDHGAVLIGYTNHSVLLADPISGQTEYDRETFERIFALRNNQCVILR